MNDSIACIAIYQAPQPAYDVFDKVVVFYEGRSIYFGHAHKAKVCPSSFSY
jgi:ATP-binding cassette subfamily G (WHITE) protein 2 (PDR)